jgi:hypothetical protein
MQGGTILKDIIVGSTCILSAAILFGLGYLKGPLGFGHLRSPVDIVYLTIIFIFVANGLFLLYKGYDE